MRIPHTETFVFSEKCTSLPDIFDLKTSTPLPVDLGARVEVDCIAGYSLSGSKLITCEKNDKWDYEETPYCALSKSFLSFWVLRPNYCTSQQRTFYSLNFLDDWLNRETVDCWCEYDIEQTLSCHKLMSNQSVAKIIKFFVNAWCEKHLAPVKALSSS